MPEDTAQADHYADKREQVLSQCSIKACSTNTRRVMHIMHWLLPIKVLIFASVPD